MNVILAETAGFCFGVERAIQLVYEQIDKVKDGQKIYTYGPIIHNAEVVRDLEEKGVFSISGPEDLSKISGSVLIIRSHGTARSVYEQAEEEGITIVDATCPFVKKIHRIVDEESRAGRRIVIIGDKNHPEVAGIIGWSNNPVTVLKNEEEAEAFTADPNETICIVSQTTFNLTKFQYIVEIIEKKGYDINVVNTICNATQARQKEAESVSRAVDVMIVIGDPKSSNTQKLYDICKTYCKDTYYIQTVKDLESANLPPGISVGITAGASTPNNIIQEVLLNVRGKKL
ncbi:MAG: 4-hydroxy-3-methylbut-2-enyl diphosphate reductase [Parasporobacterium sp.]|nr:4-hydroxy-3-methylbut-2-enyl diphosphate reductase [Parasporobacterium sp.]